MRRTRAFQSHGATPPPSIGRRHILPGVRFLAGVDRTGAGIRRSTSAAVLADRLQQRSDAGVLAAAAARRLADRLDRNAAHGADHRRGPSRQHRGALRRAAALPGSPRTIIFEDLHWFDEASIEPSQRRASALAGTAGDREPPFAETLLRNRDANRRRGRARNQSRSAAGRSGGGDRQAEIACHSTVAGASDLRPNANGRQSLLFRGVRLGFARCWSDFRGPRRRRLSRRHSGFGEDSGSGQSRERDRRAHRRPSSGGTASAEGRKRRRRLVQGGASSKRLSRGASAGRHSVDARPPRRARALAACGNTRRSPEYEFRHVISEEVTYSLLPFAQRRVLHAAIASCARGESRRAPRTALWPTRETLGARGRKAAGDQNISSAPPSRRCEAMRTTMRSDISSGRSSSATAAGDGSESLSRWETLLGDAYTELADYSQSSPHYERALMLAGQRVAHNSFERSAGPDRAHRGTGVAAARSAAPVQSGSVSIGRRAAASPIFASDSRNGIFSATSSIAVLDETLAAVNFAERGGAVIEMISGYSALAIGMGMSGLTRPARFYRDRAMSLAERFEPTPEAARAYLLAAVLEYGLGGWEDSERFARAVAVALSPARRSRPRAERPDHHVVVPHPARRDRGGRPAPARRQRGRRRRRRFRERRGGSPPRSIVATIRGRAEAEDLRGVERSRGCEARERRRTLLLRHRGRRISAARRDREGAVGGGSRVRPVARDGHRLGKLHLRRLGRHRSLSRLLVGGEAPIGRVPSGRIATRPCSPAIAQGARRGTRRFVVRARCYSADAPRFCPASRRAPAGCGRKPSPRPTNSACAGRAALRSSRSVARGVGRSTPPFQPFARRGDLRGDGRRARSGRRPAGAVVMPDRRGGPMKRKIVIIGGGMAGLAAAFDLTRTKALRDQLRSDDLPARLAAGRQGGERPAARRADRRARPACLVRLLRERIRARAGGLRGMDPGQESGDQRMASRRSKSSASP